MNKIVWSFNKFLCFEVVFILFLLVLYLYYDELQCHKNLLHSTITWMFFTICCAVNWIYSFTFYFPLTQFNWCMNSSMWQQANKREKLMQIQIYWYARKKNLKWWWGYGRIWDQVCVSSSAFHWYFRLPYIKFLYQGIESRVDPI